MKTNNTLAARHVGEQIDLLQVSIFRSLRRKSEEDAFKEDGLSVTDLCEVCAPGRPEVSLATTMLTIIVSQQVQYFNVGKTMNAAQVAMTVDDIIDRFGYMTLEEIATAFAIARRTAQIYDRLDPNTLVGWLYDYDRRRDAFCQDHAKDTTEDNQASRTVQMFRDQYLQWLDDEVANGNPDAIRFKKAYDENLYRQKDQERYDAAFKAWCKENGV